LRRLSEDAVRWLSAASRVDAGRVPSTVVDAVLARVRRLDPATQDALDQLGNLGRAQQLATAALRIANRRGDRWLIPYVLNGLAAIAVQTGRLERAATLLGTAAAMVERQGNAWPPDEAPHLEHRRAAVTAALDRQRLQQAWSAGRDMPPADAVWYALAPDPAPPLVATSIA
jgi:hypothetical protein